MASPQAPTQAAAPRGDAGGTAPAPSAAGAPARPLLATRGPAFRPQLFLGTGAAHGAQPRRPTAGGGGGGGGGGGDSGAGADADAAPAAAAAAAAAVAAAAAAARLKGAAPVGVPQDIWDAAHLLGCDGGAAIVRCFLELQQERCGGPRACASL
jgi:hypothetical protein